MRYRIRHRTRYRYAQPAFESFNEIRLQPMSCPEQTPLGFELLIDPPATVIAFQDYYGNAVHDFGVPYLHDVLTIEAVSDVVTHAAADEPLAGPAPGAADESIRLRDLAGDGQVADELAEYLGRSTYVGLDDASEAIARELVAADPDATVLGFYERAANDVKARLEYRLGTTTVESSVPEVLALGSGVCQDFAHVLISLLRHAGVPARYVSGYLGSVSEATASHAWAEAWVPPYGWVGMDATLGVRCTGTHVKVGVGRDYADVSVLRGTYQGRGQAELDVSVQTEELGGIDDVALLRGGDAARGGTLVAIQNLHAMRRFRRIAPIAATPSEGMAQVVSHGELPPTRRQPGAADDVPMQQPRQQQQQLR